MLNLGTPELLVVLLVALLVLGPTKLPEAARQVGRAMAHLRQLSAGFQAEIRDAMQEPEVQKPTVPEPTVPEPAVQETAVHEPVVTEPPSPEAGSEPTA